MPILKRGEQISRQEPAKMIVNGQVHAGGILYLTNTRVMYERKSGSGLFGGGSLVTEMDAPLGEVQNVTSSKPLIPIPLLTKNVLRIEFQGSSYEFGVQESRSWEQDVIGHVNGFRDREERETQMKLAMQRQQEEQMRAEREAKEREEQERRDAKVREEREWTYKTEVDRQRAAAEAAAHIARAGAASTSIQVGQIGDSRTDVRDSVLQRSNIGGSPGMGGGGGSVCPSCHSAVQPGWKACPACASPLAAACRHCGASVQPQWKACPACGNPI